MNTTILLPITILLSSIILLPTMPATHQGIGSTHRLSVQERAAILALNWHAEWSFGKIGERLGIPMQTAH